MRNSFKFFTPFVIVFFVLNIFMPFEQASGQRKKNKKSEKAAESQPIVIAENGMSLYRIVLPASPTVNEMKAATELQDYLIQISGAALPIIGSDKARSRYEILLGQNEHLSRLGTPVNTGELEADGFGILTDSSRLVIAGGNKKGTLYGVYTFLEKYLGCRMYSPQVRVVPKHEKIALGKIHDKQVPAIRFRDIHYSCTYDQEYSAWHRLDHDENGGKPAWGTWVHTFNGLVPPEVYFHDHPEYYALIDGTRIPTQLCLTNPEVVKVTIENLRKQVARNPEALYWSVSQNDNRQYCMCENCQAIDNREGSHSGTMINFVNQVAGEFPDHMISTLAYEYTRKAPATIRPLKNVNIMLCSIEAFRGKPIDSATDTVSMSLVRDVEDWGKIASDIIVWDYVIQFPNLISPFPNLYVLQPNIQFFVKNGVTAMFEQGNRDGGGEFAELRSYLIAKLLWDPDLNIDSLTNDFLDGYYGAGGKAIRKYIDEMHNALAAADQPLRIFGSPNEASTSYLTLPLIERYKQLFDEAEKAVADSAKILERVRTARMPLNFAIMEQSKKTYTGENGVFINKGGKWVVRPEIRSMVDPFVDLCIRTGVTQIKEWGTTPEAYRSAMYRLFSQGFNQHLAYNKPLMLSGVDTTDIPAGRETMLNDGIRGSHDPAYNWLSFEGKDLDVVIDLEKTEKVSHLECAFYQRALWLSIVPEKVEFFVSVDGKNFESAGTVENTLPIDQWDSFQRDFITDFAPKDARYVKVVAHSIGLTPQTHPGAGRPAWMHIDEIVVE
jgi:hypothetical protein